MQRLLIILGLIAIVYFFLTISIKDVQAAGRQVGTFVILLLGLTTFNIWIKSYRWQKMIFGISGKKIGTWFSFRSILAGIAAGSFIPGRIEFAKTFLAKKEYDVPMSQSASALVIERFMDFAAILLILAGSIAFFHQENKDLLIAASAMIIFLVIITITLVFYPKVLMRPVNFILRKMPGKDGPKDKLQRFSEDFFVSFKLLRSKWITVWFMFLSLAALVVEIVRLYSLFMILSIPAGISATSLVFTASVFIGILSTIPGGIGVTEISATTILSQLIPGTPKEMISSAILIERVISYYLLVAIGSTILLYQPRSRTAAVVEKPQDATDQELKEPIKS